MFLESPYFWEIQNSTISSVKIVPLCNCILLPVTVKLLEVLLEAVLWKPTQPFHCLLNYVSSITKMPSIQCWFLREVEPGEKLLQCCQIVIFEEILKQNPPGVLEHCSEGEMNCSFLGCIVLTPSLRWQRMLTYIPLFTFIIPQVLCQQILHNSGNFLKVLCVTYFVLNKTQYITGGHVVVQLVKALCYKVGRSWVRFLMVSLEFFIDIILPATLWPQGWPSL